MRVAEGEGSVKKLAEIMNRAPLIVDGDASVLSALEMMRAAGASAALVGSPAGPRGIITERDVVGWLHRRLDLETARCAEVMHAPLFCMPQTAGHIEAHHEMALRNIRHVAASDDDGRIVGLVTESDVLRAVGVEYFTEFKSVRSLAAPAHCVLPPDALVWDAVELMNRKRQTCVVVIDQDNRPIGLLTERDVVRLTVEGRASLETVLRAAARRPVHTTSPDAMVHECVATMESLKIRRLVVVDENGRLAGVLSQHEVVSGLENHYIRHLKDVVNLQAAKLREFERPFDEGAVVDALLEAHSDGLTILTDHQFLVRAANPRACQTLGMPQDEIVGTELAPLLSLLGVTSELPLTAVRLTGEETVQAALSGMDDDGPAAGASLELRIRQLKHPESGVQGYLVTARDVSERRRAAAALLAEKDFSDAIIAGLPGLFYLIDGAGRILRRNNAWRGMRVGGDAAEKGEYLPAALGVDCAEVSERFEAALNAPESELEIVHNADGPEPRIFLHKLRRAEIGRQSLFIGSAIDITERKRSMAEAERLARLDTLTGVPNRHAFMERLGQALARVDDEKGRVALLFLDIDNFKQVNDTLGHVVGDNLLRAAASRLGRLTGGGSAPARLGGDEFAFILSGDWSDGAPEMLAHAVVDAMAQPFSIDGHQIFVGASAGLVVYPGDYVDRSDLLALADLAMYRAKTGGRGCWRRFEAWMAVEAQRRRLIESELREAAPRGQFELHYQPKLSIADGRMTGAEALIRWRHPALGMISPDEFIGLAESTGLIATVGDWVVKTACREAAQWAAMGRPMKVAVNVSPVQFRRHDLAAAVRQALASSGLRPDLLELEITESAVLSDNGAAMQALEEIAALGVTIAIDDFGAGYSSLAQLRRLRFNTLKIDRSLIMPIGSDDDAHAVAAAAVTLGRSLGMKVVAEGVETAAHLEALREIGCDEGQGYYFWRPLPAALFREILAGL